MEPEELAESVGEGDDCNEDVSEKRDIDKPYASSEILPNFGMAAGLSAGNGERLGEREEGVCVGVA